MAPSDSLIASRLNLIDPTTPSEIEFELSRPATVSLALVDGEGMESEVIVQERPFREGVHRVELPPRDYARRVYFYRLTVQSESTRIIDTKRIMIVP